ncbi:hypothetical protein Tco_0283962, partial [Tanacetum coccineum]
EKRKLDACSMSPHELVEWEQQEAVDELVLHDDWQYKVLAVDDVGGSSKHYDLLHENFVYNGHSLLNIDKERFSNNVVLKKKCRNKVNVTRKTICLNNVVLKKKCRNKVNVTRKVARKELQ